MSIWRKILFLIPISLLVPGWAMAQERSYEWGSGMHPMGWMCGFWGIGMMFMMLFFWVFIIVGLVLGVRWFLSQNKDRRNDSAFEMLRQRYARGEINKEEFEAKKKD